MQIFQEFVISGECRALRKLKNYEMGVLRVGQGGREKGVLRAAHTHIPFSGE